MTLPTPLYAGPMEVAHAAADVEDALEGIRAASHNLDVASRQLNAAEAFRAMEVRDAAENGTALGDDSDLAGAREKVARAMQVLEEAQNIRQGRERGLTLAVRRSADAWRDQLADDQRTALERLRSATSAYLAAVQTFGEFLACERYIDRCEHGSAEWGSVFPPAETMFGDLNPAKHAETFRAWAEQATAAAIAAIEARERNRPDPATAAADERERRAADMAARRGKLLTPAERAAARAGTSAA